MAVISGQPSTDAIAFTISEQTGDKRTLTLTGRALPYRPIEFAGEQRTEWTAYPGNPIRSAQVLGAEEDPSEFHGMWKDRFIGTPPGASSENVVAYYAQNGLLTSLQTALDIVQLVDDMRRKGQEMVVQWGPEVRRGILRRFARRWLNIHDCEWTIRFEWASQNDPDAPAVIAKDTDYANAQGSLAAKVQAIKNAIATAQNVAADKIGEYTSQVAVIGSLVDSFADTTTNALTTAMPLFDQSRRIGGILDSIASAADDMTASVLAEPAVVQCEPVDPTIPIDGPALAVEAFNQTVTSSLRDMKFTAIDAQFDILKQVDPDVIAVFTARQDTDLRDVSQKFYGTQDSWRSLMIFNGLSSSRLNAGDTVFVPQLIRPLDGGA